MLKKYRRIILKLLFLCVSAQLYTQSLGFSSSLSSINSPFNEYMPFISQDGRILFFQSDRPNGESAYGDSDIWMAYRDERSIGEAVVFLPAENIGPPVNTQSLEGMPSFRFESTDEWHIYFASVSGQNREGTGETDIFFSMRKNGSWSEPRGLEEINTVFHDRMPYISADGSMLLFASNRPGGYGGEDIWISEYDRQNEKWSLPYNPGEMINTVHDEVSPSVHKNNRTLYFSSNRPGGQGGFDIYISQKERTSNAAAWSKPRNLGQPYNSRYDDERPSVTGDGEYIYFSSNRPKGKGSFDIYRERINSIFRPKLSITFAGHVLVEKTRKGLEANIRISDHRLVNNISTSLPHGSFKMRLQSGKVYNIVISSPGYDAYQHRLDLRHIVDKNQRVEEIFHLRKFGSGQMQMSDKMVMKDKMHGQMQMSDKMMMKDKTHDQMQMSDKMMMKDKVHDQMQMSDKTVMKDKTHDQMKMSDKMMKPNKKLLMTLYFSSGNTKSNTDKNQKLLKKLVEIWKKDKKQTFIVEGHTDKEGNKKKNIELSKKRSLFIKNELQKRGIPQEKLISEWHDFSRPISVEKNNASRGKNRRVEVYVRK